MKSNKKGNHLYAYKDTIRRLFLLTLFSFLIVESYAQNKTISGTVTDFTGEPVIGASVLVNGTTNGTSFLFPMYQPKVQSLSLI